MSNPSEQHKNDNDNQDDSDDADTTMSITVTVAAEAAAEAAQQEDDEDDNENEPQRHKLAPLALPRVTPWFLRGVDDRYDHSRRLAGDLDAGLELMRERFDDGGAQAGTSAATSVLL